MTSALTESPPRLARKIVQCTRGHSHGPITRLVSPSDLGELIKPFVFLDYFDIDPKRSAGIGFHPHSGIATLTLLLEGQIFYEDTSGAKGIIEPGGVEWMRAAGGVWHTGGVQEPRAPGAISFGSRYLRRWKVSNPKRSTSEESTSSRTGPRASFWVASAKPPARSEPRRR